MFGNAPSSAAPTKQVALKCGAGKFVTSVTVHSVQYFQENFGYVQYIGKRTSEAGSQLTMTGLAYAGGCFHVAVSATVLCDVNHWRSLHC